MINLASLEELAQLSALMLTKAVFIQSCHLILYSLMRTSPQSKYLTTLHLSSRFVDLVIFFYFRALQPPNWLAQWHCGVRVTSNNKLVGFIAAVPLDVLIYKT